MFDQSYEYIFSNINQGLCVLGALKTVMVVSKGVQNVDFLPLISFNVVRG